LDFELLTMASVEFEHIFKVYPNGYTALKNLCLTIEDGEFLVLVGPSGCGKSTALRILAGLEDITAGKLIISGEVVNEKSPQQRNIAMVFQNYALYPHMTVRQNLEFPLRMMNVPGRERQGQVREAAQKLGLSEFLECKPKQLSGGQRQRVAMGRAIVRDPAVFLMDEPLSNLDAKMRVQIRSEIAQLQRRTQKTTVYVTHDQVEAMTMGERVAVLQAGELQQVAPPQELYDRPANVFVAGFIGSPAMNIFLTQLQKTENGTFLLEFGPQSLVIPQAVVDKYQDLEKYLDRPILAGWRPESFFLAEAGASDHHYLQVELEAVEALGHEMLVYFHASVSKLDIEDNYNNFVSSSQLLNKEKSNSILIARIPASQSFSRDSRLKLGVDMSKLYLFTAEGNSIKGSIS
jgi:multiple sugar transport system ATP-binding protein